MRFSWDLDRRTFLKLGVAGTAAAAINPSMGLASVHANHTLSSPPTLVEMASDRLTYQLRDLFNCPLAMNEWGYAQVAKSVSAITAISFPPYACCGVPETAWSPGFLLTCEIFLNGRFLAIAASPDGNVEYQWFPHCVVRTQTAENLQFSTRMFLPSKHRAVVQSITIKNLSAAQRHFTLALDMRGAVAKKTKPWFVNSPGEVDNPLRGTPGEAVFFLRRNIPRSPPRRVSIPRRVAWSKRGCCTSTWNSAQGNRRVNSHLGSFDSSARLEGVRYQGGLYTITKDGAQREKA